MGLRSSAVCSYVTAVLSLVVVCVLCLVASEAVAAGAAGSGSGVGKAPDRLPDGWGVARFLGDEGRMVIERGEDVAVLRQGDALPGRPGCQLQAIGRRSALLVDADPAKSDGGPAGNAETRWLLVELSEDGGTRITVIMQQAPEVDLPEAVTSGSVIQLVPTEDGVMAVPVQGNEEDRP